MIPVEQFYEVIWKRHLKKYNIDALTYLPYGSSNISDLSCVQSNRSLVAAANCIFNDQEPITQYAWKQFAANFKTHWNKLSFWQKHQLYFFHQLQDVPNLNVLSFSGKVFLTHSELYSDDVAYLKENCDVIPIYYWWHGFASRYWFYTYQFDPDIAYTVEPTQQRFLLYSRAFTGTREYRLKLLEQIAKRGVANAFKLNFHAEDGLHYSEHVYHNAKFKCNVRLEDYFTEGEQWEASASASINVDDFRSTRISVVAETVFEDKVFFSEKICKAIAAGHPFVLLCGAHSLEVLRGYGFKTFGDFWDESYDTIEDSYQRIMAISKLLEKLAKMPQDEFDNMCNRMKEVVDYNQQWFYSKEFEQVLIDELDRNFTVVKDIAPLATGPDHFALMKYDFDQGIANKTRSGFTEILKHIHNVYPSVYSAITTIYQKELDQYGITLPTSTVSSEEQ